MCKITWHEFRGFTGRCDILCPSSLPHLCKPSPSLPKRKGEHANLASEVIIGTLSPPLENLILGNSSWISNVKWCHCYECQALRCVVGCNRERDRCCLVPQGAHSLVRETVNQLKWSFLKDLMERAWSMWTQRVIILTSETWYPKVQLEAMCVFKKYIKGRENQVLFFALSLPYLCDIPSCNFSSIKWNDNIYPANSWDCYRECTRECIWKCCKYYWTLPFPMM